VNKAVGAGRTDCLLVEAHRFNIAALQAGNLGPNQGGAVFEIVRAMLRPDLDLFVMRREIVHELPPLAGSCGIARGGSGQRTVKVIFRCFEMRN
jgi:hypothetical protein